MRTSARNSVRVLVDFSRLSVGSGRKASRTFVSTSSLARQEKAPKGTTSNATAKIGKLDRVPIAWTTATTSYSQEANSFVSGNDNDTIDSFEVIADEKEELPTSLIARSKVRRGVIVECRRSVSHV